MCTQPVRGKFNPYRPIVANNWCSVKINTSKNLYQSALGNFDQFCPLNKLKKYFICPYEIRRIFTKSANKMFTDTKHKTLSKNVYWPYFYSSN